MQGRLIPRSNHWRADALLCQRSIGQDTDNAQKNNGNDPTHPEVEATTLSVHWRWGFGLGRFIRH
jgi:hypothetical protein